MAQPIAVTGIQASGDTSPTLGNYLGMYQPAVQLQSQYQLFYFVADLHAITAKITAETLRRNTLIAAAWYLASGLDPAQSTLFVQSAVPAHPKLAWVLNAYTQMGELERMTQFKDKSQQYSHNINVGLFTYPVLQAADIVLYHANVVPVGADQKQHIELTRDIAHRFNTQCSQVFTLPEPLIRPQTARIRDLQDPTRKMSKSIGGQGTVYLLDDAQTMAKKLKRAVTDTTGQVAYNPEQQPGLANLIDIMAACTGQTPAQIVQDFAGDQYGPFKQAVADAVIAQLAPVQQRYTEFQQDPAELARILAAGSERAAAVANATLAKVYDAVGFVV